MAKRGNSKKVIRAPGFLCEAIQYNSAFSRGVRVDSRAMTMLFISGTASIDSQGKSLHRGDFLAQSQRVFDNISALLDSENISWKDVVQTRCYLKSMRYYKKFNEIRTKFYQKQGLIFFPASVCVEARLCRPELLIEIEALAISGIKRKNGSLKKALNFRKNP